MGDEDDKMSTEHTALITKYLNFNCDRFGFDNGGDNDQ